MLVYLLVSMFNYGKAYDEIVSNLRVANSYNLNFKEEIDESLYKLVAGYVSFDNIAKEEHLKDPYILVEDLKEEFEKLLEVTTGEESKLWLHSLLRNIDTLEDRIDDVVSKLDDGKSYDENIKELDENIYILTDLIQDDIQYYIYYQTRNMSEVSSMLNDQLRDFIIVFGIIIGTLVFVLFILVVLVTNGIISPIKEVTKAIGKMSKGDFAVRAKTTSKDELAVLTEGFNDMAGNMQSLVGKIKEDEQKIRQADLRLLQEQINPHFLYNTLDTIIWLIEGSEPEQAVDMVVALSDFFRMVLSKGKEFISIQDEELHIHSYLEVQSMRYNDILSYEINIDPEIYDYRILKLTLQPLVENSLYHGIKCKRGKGKIEIFGRRVEGTIEFIVRDDGVGMEEGELVKLREEILRPCKETERGFGLANVNERIRMYFGNQYGIKIDSKKGKGTKIRITLPIVKNGPTEEGIKEETNEEV